MIEKLNANTMRFVTQGVRQTEIDPALIALKGCAVHAFQKKELQKKLNKFINRKIMR